MKINTKTIFIAVVVAAVAAYLVWQQRKKKTNTTGNASAAAEEPAESHATLDYILNHVVFRTNELQKIEQLQKQCEQNYMLRSQIQAQANEKGRTFDQQLVLNAIWALYHPGSSWIAGPDGTTAYGWNLQQKVIKL